LTHLQASCAAVKQSSLEQLSRDRAGQHSIRINDQWRICFRWKTATPTRSKSPTEIRLRFTGVKTGIAAIDRHPTAFHALDPRRSS
jgi:hypothetical protein